MKRFLTENQSIVNPYKDTSCYKQYWEMDFLESRVNFFIAFCDDAIHSANLCYLYSIPPLSLVSEKFLVKIFQETKMNMIANLMTLA